MPHRYYFTTRVVMAVIFSLASATISASPALNTFMQEIWGNNPSVKSAKFGLEAAKANLTAMSQPIYNPEIGVDIERTDVNSMSIGLNQSIDRGNKQVYLTKNAEAFIAVAQAEFDLQRLTIAEQFLHALADLRSTLNMQQLAQQRVDLMDEFVVNTDKRQQAGDIGLQDVALARVALSEAKMQLARTMAQQAENEARLHATSGIESTEWPVFAKEPPAITATLNVEKYLLKLPKLSALKAQFVAAKSNVNLSKANRKADPNFGFRGGMDGSNALVGLSFSIPLNVRNSYRAEVEVAYQESLQIEQMFFYETHQAKAHIRGAYRGYQITYGAWQLWKTTGLSSLQEQLKLIRAFWKSGEMSTSDYLVQARQNVDAQETAVELSAQMWTSWLEWLASSGQIENWLNQKN